VIIAIHAIKTIGKMGLFGEYYCRGIGKRIENEID